MVCDEVVSTWVKAGMTDADCCEIMRSPFPVQFVWLFGGEQEDLDLVHLCALRDRSV
jgi:hypothetical protein